MNIRFKRISPLLLLASALLVGTSMRAAATMSLADRPLFLVSIPPVVMVMLDNSGSMTEAMYPNGFSSSVSYHGIFDSLKNYVYDVTIPVNSGAYPVTVDTTKTGAFVESTCTPSAADKTCWSGNYLNWLTTRRIDSSRTVLVGGKLESEASFSYGSDGAGHTLNYKIVGNNEFSDRDFTKSYALSSHYSPIGDGQSVLVSSPTNSSGGGVQATYDPYAKIRGGGGSQLYDSSGAAIGEFGTVVTDNNWTTVSFAGNYTSPVVVATAPSFNGGDPGVVRLRNVDPDAGTFQVSFQEWDYRDGGHIDETISYVVMEGSGGGLHTLPDGITVKAGTVDTNELLDNGNCGSTGTTDYTSVSFVAGFSAAPVLIASVMTRNDSDPVTARTWDITSSAFKLALQEEEDRGYHGTETVGYIAIEAGNSTDATNHWAMEAGTTASVTDSIATVNFSTPGGVNAPAFVAAIQTRNENDTAVLRTDELSASSARIHVEEEKSCDTEVSHAAEVVGYAAFWGLSDRNIALAVPNKPAGLLQGIDGRVRLGVSFYRYDLDKSDIYNGVTTNGGTLNFKIPKNPYVKKPTSSGLPVGERGYRELSGYIGTDIGDISDAIQHYPLIWGTTPIAENLWEVIQYFEQDNPYYSAMEAGFPDFELADTNGDGVDEVPERDPFYYPDYNAKLECAAPSVVIFTDGEPYKDAAIPAAIRDYDGDGHSKDVASSVPDAQGQDNLDDVAFWGFCNKSDGAACPDSNVDGVIDSDDKGSRDLRSDISGDQFLRVYTVGFAGGSIANILQDTADNAGGQAYAAQDGASLETALSAAFSDAISASSAAAVSLDAGSISDDTKLYQARFDGTNWTGDLLAFSLGSDGSLPASPDWNAADLIPAYNLRNIYTRDDSTGVAFTWPNLTATQKAALLDDSTLLDFIRGDRSNESDSGFRARGGVLGDIVHSSPLFVGPPGLPYPDDWNGSTNEPEDSTLYSAFVSNATNASRTSVVYTGANDGMLHAFNATTGVELFAYVPSMLLGSLPDLAGQSYSHRFYVDGPPTVLDAFYGSAWHSVLVGGLRAGGQGVYALDVTSPGTFSASNVLWEFSDANDADMGYSFSQPNIVRMYSGRTSTSTKWAAVFGNGYDSTHADGTPSTTGHAVLYIIDIQNGSVIKKIDTGVGDTTNPNGLSTAAPVDVDGDHIVDYIYAGDLRGNLWKFDVSSSNTASWGVAFSGQPLFTACAGSDCSTAARQPITTRPQVGRHPNGQGVMVYFGTGKYFETGDDSSAGQTTQSFYGVWDRGEDHQAFDRDHLLQQKIVAEVSASGFDYRVVSNNGITWHSSTSTLPSGSPPTTHLGWYIDLYNTEASNTDNFGERQVSQPVLRNDRIIFTTLLPSAEACDAGGSSWLMELSTANGGQLPYTPFDVDGDSAFDLDDYADVDGTTERVPVSGKKSKVGIVPTPGILSMPGEEKELKFTSGSSGDIETTLENPGPDDSSRRSWRQLR